MRSGKTKISYRSCWRDSRLFPTILPDDIRKVVRKNGPKYDSYYFDDFYRRLKSDFLETKPEERGDEDAYVTQTAQTAFRC